MSHLISAMRDAIKTETELYTMRIQQQMNRYCSVIENSVAFSGGSARDNYQDQIDALKSAVDSIMANLYQYKCQSVCSSDLDNDIDIIPETNLVVNKVKPEEIKEVHINLENDVVDDEGVSDADSVSDSVAEVVIENEVVAGVAAGVVTSYVNAPVSSAATVATLVTNEEAVEDEEEEAEEEVVDEEEQLEEEVEEEVVEEEVEEEGEVEDEAEEDAAEEEATELELEEIEWKGTKYYKDTDDNVYEYLTDGEVGDVIGSMSKKIAGKVLLYAV